VPLHRSYVEAVREVAAQEQTALCDLAAEIHALPKDERASLFRQDGIHFSAAGSRRAARMLFRCLERDGALALVPASAPAPHASTPVRAR